LLFGRDSRKVEHVFGVGEQADDRPDGQGDGRLGEYLSELREAPTEALEHSFQQLDLLESGVHAHKLLVLSVLDERDVGREDGAFDTADWVARTSRIARARALALVDTARALRDRPAIAAVATEGRLSSEQLEPAVRVATPQTDREWAEHAPGMSPSALRAALRRERTVTNEEAETAHASRRLTFSLNPESGVGRIRGTLAYDDAARVKVALDRIAEQACPAPNGLWDPCEQRLADALVELSSTRLADDADADRACVYVHVTERALSADRDAPSGQLADLEMPVAHETARRLSCDCTLRVLLEDEKGIPIRLGRRRRTVPPHLFRLLKQRDRHCQFPGCSRTRGLHAHHRVHYADGGATDLDNLILLCCRHHRFLHEGRWRIEQHHPTAPFRFYRPDGRPFETRPPPMEELVKQVLEPA